MFVDFHCDTISELLKRPEENLYQNSLKIDLKRLISGGCKIQTFAVYTNAVTEEDPWDCALQQIKLIENSLQQYPNLIERVYSSKDVVSVFESDHMGLLTSIEDLGICDGKQERLEYLFQKGARIATLTWNYENCMGTSNRQGKDNRLTNTGREFAEHMDELGMIPDVSHLSDGGFGDLSEIVRGPIIATHSNSRAKCDHIRNLTDEQIRVIAEHGGVIGLNFYPEFILKGSSDPISSLTLKQELTETSSYKEELESALAAHAKHIVQVGGEHCIVLGSDFDGFEDPTFIKDTSMMPSLINIFEKNRISDSLIDKILYQNAYEFLKASL